MKKQTTALFLMCSLILTPLTACSSQNNNISNDNPTVNIQKPAVEYQKVKIYLPNDNADGLNEKEVQIEKNDEPMVELVQALVTAKALPDGTEVEKWSVSDDDEPAVTLDLNDAFAEGIQNTGTSGEDMMLASLVNTIWEYFKPASITITINGKPLETGHNIYDTPFTEPYKFQ